MTPAKKQFVMMVAVGSALTAVWLWLCADYIGEQIS